MLADKFLRTQRMISQKKKLFIKTGRIQIKQHSEGNL